MRSAQFGVRRQKRSGDGALDGVIGLYGAIQAVSRYDHPSAAAAPGTPVFANAPKSGDRALD